MTSKASSTAVIPFQEDSSTLVVLKEIITMSIPLGFAGVAQICISATLSAMVGTLLGAAQLGAVTMSFGLINAAAFSIAAGFCGALETILSHSYGRDPNSKLYGTYGQRMVLMLLILALFIGPFILFADRLLLAMGQNPVVTYYTGKFCSVAVFGVFPAMMLEFIRRYYACQHLNNPLSVNLVTSAAVFPFVVWVCIKALGFYGAPLAWVLLMVCMPGSLILFLIFTGKYKKTWGGWNLNAFRNWGPMLKLALPSMAMMLSEWMSLEINCLMAGFGTTNELAAFSIIYQTSGILWSLASGTFIVSAVVVGNALGQGRARLARRSAYLCVMTALGFAIVNLILLLLLRNALPLAFSTDEEVLRLFHEMLPFFCVYHFFDCFQSCMMGVFRGCGMQRVGAVCITLVYSIVGVPTGVVLFFTTSIGVKALWIGPAIGVTLAGAPMYIYIMLYRIKWDEIHVTQEELPSLDISVDEMRSLGGTSLPVAGPHTSVGDDRDPFADALHSGEEDGEDQLDNNSFASQLAHFRVPQRSLLHMNPLVGDDAVAVRNPKPAEDDEANNNDNNSP